jgi:hypothetical protein
MSRRMWPRLRAADATEAPVAAFAADRRPPAKTTED